MKNERIEKLLDEYYDLESKFFFRHIHSNDFPFANSEEAYKEARRIMDEIERLLNCQYREFVVIRLELSDPIWYYDDRDIFPTAISPDELRLEIEHIDNMSTSRWVNPSLICVPVEVCKYLEETSDDNGRIYDDFSIYAIAGPYGGYTSNIYDWIVLNKKHYLPKIFNAYKRR